MDLPSASFDLIYDAAVSREPLNRSKRGVVLPQKDARRFRAASYALRACRMWSRAVETAIRARVSSTGETFPALTRCETAPSTRSARRRTIGQVGSLTPRSYLSMVWENISTLSARSF